MSDAERRDRVEYVRRNGRGDERHCGHEDLVSHPDCVECAYDLGKRSGHAEAGAYYTWAEVKAKLTAEFGGPPKEPSEEAKRAFLDSYDADPECPDGVGVYCARCLDRALKAAYAKDFGASRGEP